MLYEYSIGAKWLKLLKEISPGVKRVAFIVPAAALIAVRNIVMDFAITKTMDKAAFSFLSRMLLGCCLVLATPTVFAANFDPNWKEFVLPDSGTRVQYPAGIFSVSRGKAEMGTGQRLSTPDERASLTVYARANGTGETPTSYLRKNLRMADSIIQYRRITPSFFAISAEREGMIYYSRCNFGGGATGAIHCFDLIYPQPEKRAWDAIVTRISLSLRPLQG